jgi:hypothetical protein
MKNADVKSALQKKSPGKTPGRTFLQEKVYQTHNPLVKNKISTGGACHGPPISQVSSEVSPLRRCTASPFMPVLDIYIMVTKIFLAFLFTEP